MPDQTARVIPVLATATRIYIAETKTLEHGSLLLVRVVVDSARAEAVAEVLIVFVAGVGGLGVDAFLIGVGIEAKSAALIGREAGGTAVACKVALLEDLDELMLPVTLDRA